MYKNSEEQKSLNNKINLQRNSSLLSTCSSLRVKKIKLRNEFSPFHIIGKASNTKNVINFPVCISLFTNNFSINEKDTKVKLNQNSKKNMKFIHSNNSSIKENKKIISRNPNSFFINSFSTKNLNTQSINISNYYKFSSSGMKNLSKPKLVKLNYSPSYKFTQQNIPTKNKNNSMTNTTIEQDLSGIKSTNNTLNNNKISKIKYLLSSPHTSEGLENGKKEEKIPKMLSRKNKIKKFEGISNLKYNKNSKIYDEINKIINESNLKKKYKLNIGTNNNKSNNTINNNLSPINNKKISEINSLNLEKSIEDIETNIENNLESNIDNKNKILEDIKNTNLEKKTNNNDNDSIKKLKDKMEEKSDIFKTKAFQQLKKNVSEFQKKKKEKKKITFDNKDKKDNIENKYNKDIKGQPSTNYISTDKNILKEIKKNKFYLTICKGKTNDIYRDNDFLNDLNKSTKNINHMNLFTKKAQMLIKCKKSTDQKKNHEKNRLKQKEISEKINSYLVQYFTEENPRKEDKHSKEIAEYINSIKKLKIEYKYICNLGFESRFYIQNEIEFEGFPYILTGKKSSKHLELIMENSFVQLRRFSCKDNFLIKNTNLKVKNKDKDKDEDKMNKSVINMLAIHQNILKSLYYYEDSKKIKSVNKNNNNLEEKKKIFDKDENKKAILSHNSSSKILLKAFNKQSSSNLNLNHILNNRKILKKSPTLLIRDSLLRIKNSQNSDINMNHYSILRQKHFFKKRKLNSNDKNCNRRDSIFLINEKDNSREDSQDDDKIYIELIKLIFEGKNNSFINLYKKNKKYIDVNKDLFDGNTLLILSSKDGNFFISKFLCEQGAKINAQNHNGNTALHYAIGKQFYGVADILTRHGAKEDIKNNMGLTPWECIENNIED